MVRATYFLSFFVLAPCVNKLGPKYVWLLLLNIKRNKDSGYRTMESMFNIMHPLGSNKYRNKNINNLEKHKKDIIIF
jgi:hypothetical protein